MSNDKPDGLDLSIRQLSTDEQGDQLDDVSGAVLKCGGGGGCGGGGCSCGADTTNTN